MERFIQPAFVNMWITLIICITVILLVWLIAHYISAWHKKEIEAEEREKTNNTRIAEKEEREQKRKDANAKKAKTDNHDSTPEEEALKKELQRKERVLDLTKALCAMVRGQSGQYDQNAVDKLFDIYKKIDEYEKQEKQQS